MPRSSTAFRTISRCGLPLLAGLFGLTLAGGAHALEFGHARVLSGAGQPLRAEIAIVQLSAQELADVQVHIAPEAAWRQAGLTPPVDLSSLRVRLVDGLRHDARVVRLSSDQIFAGAVADFFVDVQTAIGMRRHQVSVLVQRRALTLADGADAASVAVSSLSIPVRRGDTLFFIAQRHAVSGFTVYQMMAALFHENASAFIDDNMNLVRAGAVLQLPNAVVLARLTDRQARQLFVQHARAYAQRRGRSVAADALENAVGLTRVTDALSTDALSSENAQVEDVPPPRDQLQLRVDDVVAQRFGGEAALIDAGQRQTDGTGAAGSAAQDSLARIAQLEENIQDLHQALQELVSPPGAQASESATLLASGAGQGDSPPAARALAARQNGVSTEQQGTVLATPALAAQQPTPRPAPESGQTPASSDAATPGVFAPGVSNAAAVTAPAVAAPRTTSQTPAQGSGLTNIMWTMIAAGAALLILLFVCLLRRARAEQSAGGKITDAMIQEKLDTIDLNLDLDPDDSPQRRR